MDSVDKLLINGLKLKAFEALKNKDSQDHYYLYTNELKKIISNKEYTYMMRCFNPCLTCLYQDRFNDDYCYTNCVGSECRDLYYKPLNKDFNWVKERVKFEESLK